MFFLPSLEAISCSVSRTELQVDPSVCSKYPQLINHTSTCIIDESSNQPGKQVWLWSYDQWLLHARVVYTNKVVWSVWCLTHISLSLDTQEMNWLSSGNLPRCTDPTMYHNSTCTISNHIWIKALLLNTKQDSNSSQLTNCITNELAN